MRVLIPLVLAALLTIACHDARVSTDSRTEKEKQKVQEEHKKEMKEATDAYRSMKISEMAGQKQEDKKSSRPSVQSKEDTRTQDEASEQKRQP